MTDRSFGYVLDTARPIRSAFPLLARVSRTKASVDLRDWTPPVQDQGSTSSCTGQAAKVLFDIALAQQSSPVRSSALGLYTLGRYAMYSAGEPLQDNGAHFRALFDQAMNFGVLAESDCPWSPSHINDDPGFDALVNGQNSLLRASNWYTVDSDGDARHQEVRAALSAGHGVGGAWGVKKGFTRCASAFYDPGADGSEFAGNHAMALIGYDEDRYLLQNSWGTEFGLDGYVWVPLRFVEEAFDLSVVTLLSVDTAHVLRYDVRHDRDPDLLHRRPRLRVPPPEPPFRGLPGA